MTNQLKFYSVVLTYWNNNHSSHSSYCFTNKAEAEAFALSKDTHTCVESPEGSNTWYNDGCEPSQVSEIFGTPELSQEGDLYVNGHYLMGYGAKFVQISRTGLTSSSRWANKPDNHYIKLSEESADLNNPNYVPVYLGTLNGLFSVETSTNDTGKDSCYLLVPRTDDAFAEWGVYFIKDGLEITANLLNLPSMVDYVKWLLEAKGYTPAEVPLGGCKIVYL